MKAQTVQGVAEYERSRQICVVKRFDSEVVTGAEQLLRGGVPDGESEIANQVMEAVFAPRAVGEQDQFRVGGIRRHPRTARSKFLHQCRSAIDAGIGDNPDVPVDAAGLLVRGGAATGLEEGMAETGFETAPDILAIRPAKTKRCNHAVEQLCGNRSTVRIYNADDSTHGWSGSVLPGRDRECKKQGEQSKTF